MMKTADSRQSQNVARLVRACFNRPPCRCRLLHSDVRVVFVIVGQIVTPKPPEMLLVQRDDVIEYFAACTADPALCDSVLPGASSNGANGANATGFQELENIAAEFAIPVEQDVPEGAGKRKSLAQLLHDPIARGVCRNIEVQDSPSIVRNDKKAVEGAKRQAWNGEKIKRADDLTVVVEEGQPLLGFALIRTTLETQWARQS